MIRFIVPIEVTLDQFNEVRSGTKEFIWTSLTSLVAGELAGTGHGVMLLAVDEKNVINKLVRIVTGVKARNMFTSGNGPKMAELFLRPLTEEEKGTMLWRRLLPEGY